MKLEFMLKDTPLDIDSFRTVVGIYCLQCRFYRDIAGHSTHCFNKILHEKIMHYPTCLNSETSEILWRKL